jgi:hypothetical protein
MHFRGRIRAAESNAKGIGPPVNRREHPPPARSACPVSLPPARHECGIKIRNARGIEYARRLLGHTNISTPQRYMHLDDNDLAEAQDLVD